MNNRPRTRPLRRALAVATAVALALAGGCAGPAGEDAPDGTGGDALGSAAADGSSAASADAGPDAATDAVGAAVDLFDPGRLLVIDIELAEAAWDALRFEKRDLSGLLGPDCRSGPFDSNFTWHKASVRVDGSKLDEVGVRKKGFVGSMSTVKPSLKLKFDKWRPDQRAFGRERMTLNNNRQDPSLVRTCLGYAVFAAVGVPAPRCSLALVRVNGRSLGIYSHVEDVKRDFLARHFDDADGDLYEGTLSDFRPGWLATFEAKTDATDPAHPALDALAATLSSPDEGLIAALEAQLDLPAFLRFWAAEVLLSHWDGYSGNRNNYFVYREPSGGKLHLLPWGTDGVLRERPGTGPAGPADVQAAGRLTRRLYAHPEGRTRYLEALGAALASWNPAALQAQIAGLQALVSEHVATDPLLSASSHAEDTAALQAFVAARAGRIAAVQATPPAWTAAEEDFGCLTIGATAQGSFSTTWGSLAVANAWLAGQGTIAGEANGAPYQASAGVKAGPADDAPGLADVHVIFAHPSDPDLYYVLVLRTPAVDFSAGLSMPLGGLFGSGGFLLTFRASTQKVDVAAWIWDGSFELEQAATEPGAPVKGSFDLELVWAGG